MLRKFVLGTGLALMAAGLMTSSASAQTASQCTPGDQECIREQVIFNITNGDSILNNISFDNRVGVGGAPVNFNFANNPQIAAALSNASFRFNDQQRAFVNGFIRQNGALLFNKLSTLGGGIYLTLINDLLKKAGADPIP